MEEKFLKAYDEHADALFRYCYFKVYDRERAKDFVQEAYTRTWVYLSEGKKVDNLRAFLYRLLHNIIVDDIRKKKSLSLDKMGEENFMTEVPSNDNTEDVAVAREVADKLSLLDELHREVIQMRFIDDMSVGDIAKVLKISENVASVRIHRAIKKLRDIFEKNH